MIRQSRNLSIRSELEYQNHHLPSIKRLSLQSDRFKMLMTVFLDIRIYLYAISIFCEAKATAQDEHGSFFLSQSYIFWKFQVSFHFYLQKKVVKRGGEPPR